MTKKKQEVADRIKAIIEELNKEMAIAEEAGLSVRTSQGPLFMDAPKDVRVYISEVTTY